VRCKSGVNVLWYIRNCEACLQSALYLANDDIENCHLIAQEHEGVGYRFKINQAAVLPGDPGESWLSGLHCRMQPGTCFMQRFIEEKVSEGTVCPRSDRELHILLPS
jgi:hypothetical protein